MEGITQLQQFADVLKIFSKPEVKRGWPFKS